MIGFGNAVKEMAEANIFAGDLSTRISGDAARAGDLYDYDEIEFMTDMNFRHIPARTPEDELAAEPGTRLHRTTSFPRNSPVFC